MPKKPIDELTLRVFSEFWKDPEQESDIVDFLATRFNDVTFMTLHMRYGCEDCREIFNLANKAEIGTPEAQKFLVEKCGLDADELQTAAERFELLKRELDGKTLQ